MSAELSADRLKSLYDRFCSSPQYGAWGGRFTAGLQWAQSLNSDEFRTPANQEGLWRLQRISTLGLGEAVVPTSAFTDAEVVDAFSHLRFASLPAETAARAVHLQKAYDRVMGLVHPKHSKFRPQAMLARLFTALLPREMLTTYSRTSARNVTELVLGVRSVPLIGGMVRVRARLRQVLGEEVDVADDVQRSMFVWWLHENHAELLNQEDPASLPPVPDAPPEYDVQPKLVLWPLAQQRKGLMAVGGYLETWRSVVSAARHGGTRDDIITTLETVYGLGKLSPASRRSLFNDVRNNGFLANENGLWHPSEDGLVLVDQDPPDIIVERFLVQSFGLAQVLRYLRGGARTRSEIYTELRRQYPAWTVDFGPSAQLAWARELGLVFAEPDGKQALTEYGKAWEARLPDELPVVEVSAVGETEKDPPPRPTTEFAPQRFEDLLAHIKQKAPKFVLDETQLRSLHVALHSNPAKRFVILSGLSGTGKTALLRHYAEAYLALCRLPPGDHLAIVPVSPDWRDPTALLGYFNPLHSEPTWQKEHALRLLLAAAEHPDKPFFLVLDEMNLAQVEHYFAPFLSAMETGLPLQLHQEDDDVNGVPQTLPWPKNLFIGGTLNMDETTQTVSDKVLDRAFTLEFWDVNLEDFLDRSNAKPEVRSLLVDLHGILAKARRHFGYRTAGEILSYVGHEDATSELLDHAIFAKVLPRIRGEDSPLLIEAIEAARARCLQENLTRSADKLAQMQARLASTGVTRFWA